jgi:hypothetical protein
LRPQNNQQEQADYDEGDGHAKTNAAEREALDLGSQILHGFIPRSQTGCRISAPEH